MINAITLSISILGSLAAATTVKSVHTIIYGFWPTLPRISLATAVLRSVVSLSSRHGTALGSAATLEHKNE